MGDSICIFEIYFERTLYEFLLENYIETRYYLYNTGSIYLFNKLISKFYGKLYLKNWNKVVRYTLRNIENISSNYTRVMDLVPKEKVEMFFNTAKELRGNVEE